MKTKPDRMPSAVRERATDVQGPLWGGGGGGGCGAVWGRVADGGRGGGGRALG